MSFNLHREIRRHHCPTAYTPQILHSPSRVSSAPMPWRINTVTALDVRLCARRPVPSRVCERPREYHSGSMTFSIRSRSSHLRYLHNPWLPRSFTRMESRRLNGNAQPNTSHDASPHETSGEHTGAVHSTDDIEVDGFGRRLSDIDRQYAAQKGIERRIHIVGTGSIGKLVAHSLRGLPDPPPVTLVFHRYRLLEAWEKSDKVITLADDGFEVPRRGMDVELMAEVRREHGVEIARTGRGEEEALGDNESPENSADGVGRPKRRHSGEYAISSEPIHNLIITTKVTNTIPALLALRHRLNADSTICFLQNGMGILDEVNKQVFPDPVTRPSYIQGIITHGVNVPPQRALQDPFFAVHAGHGSIALGLLPRGRRSSSSSGDARHDLVEGTSAGIDRTKDVQSDKWAPSARYILRTLTRSPVLCAVGFTPLEHLQLQLEKLAVNSVLNVMTALLDSRNGTILYNFALTRTMRLLLAETSQVIRSLPELAHVPNVELRFSADRLESQVVSVAHKTRDNISSMLADVRAGNRTEVEYINGYIVRRGEEVGIKCVVNYAMMQTVIGKAQMVQQELKDDVALDKRALNPD